MIRLSSTDFTIRGTGGALASGVRAAARFAALGLLIVAAGQARALDSTPAFEQTVYPLLRQYCAFCHAGSGPGSPSIASISVDTAHSSVVDNQKVNFMAPGDSRLVKRLSEDRHFCWSNCAQDGVAMRMKIDEWATLVAGGPGGGGGGGGGGGDPGGGGNPGGGDPGNTVGLVTQPTTFAQGSIARTDRYDRFLIARYDFKEGNGPLVHDTSGVAPAMDLTLEGDVKWLERGLEFTAGRAIATRETSQKLHDRIAGRRGTHQYTVEAWVAPASLDQIGPARIATYSNGTSSRNFMLGQQFGSYAARNRSIFVSNRRWVTNGNGTPNLMSESGALQDSLQHVVMTFHFHPRFGYRKIWVNGQLVSGEDPVRGRHLRPWDPSHQFVVGNETSNNRPWRGQILFLGIHNRVLLQRQIEQNYAAGVHETFVLSFPMTPWLPAGNVLELEASEYDAYSYLFCRPKLAGRNVNNLAVEGVRVMVNGVSPVMGQSFASVDTMARMNQPLSELCAIVPKDQGRGADSFRVHFDRLAQRTEPTPEPPPAAPDESDLEALPDVGIRSFEQIHDTMSTVTGVPKSTPEVEETFDELLQALPASNDIRTFVSAHQTSIAKLALEYCDALVNGSSLRQAFFGSQFEFNQPVPTAFSSQAKRDLVIRPVLDRMVGADLASQPDRAALEAELNQLIGGLIRGCSAQSCPASRTQAVVKATCAAVLPSAVTLVE
jgi:hypothetical protein